VQLYAKLRVTLTAYKARGVVLQLTAALPGMGRPLTVGWTLKRSVSVRSPRVASSSISKPDSRVRYLCHSEQLLPLQA
jgi:hypothetical protein